MTTAEDNLPKEQPKTINLTARLKGKAPALNMKPLLKVGLAAAAVIAIGVVMLFNTPAVKAVSFEQIRKAIKNAKNVYIATFSDKMELIQEKWVSRSLNIYMTKTGKKFVLLDLANKVRRETGSVETSSLSTRMVTETEKMMTGFLGLVPFDDLALLPEDVEWKYVGNKDSGNITETTEKYELTWLEKTGASHTIFNKLVFFVDSKTNRPLKTEFYEKSESDIKYNLQSTKEIEYPSDDKIRSKIKEVLP